MEYEGVVVEETAEVHRQAWLQLAQEEGKPAPLQWALKRADGMKAEQVRMQRSILYFARGHQGARLWSDRGHFQYVW